MIEAAVAAISGVCFFAVVIIVMCAKHDSSPLEEPESESTVEEVNCKKSTFKNELEEASENVGYHTLAGVDDNVCFPMDQYHDEIPEEPQQKGREVLFRSYVMPVKEEEEPAPALVRKPGQESESYEEYTASDE